MILEVGEHAARQAAKRVFHIDEPTEQQLSVIKRVIARTARPTNLRYGAYSGKGRPWQRIFLLPGTENVAIVDIEEQFVVTVAPYTPRHAKQAMAAV